MQINDEFLQGSGAVEQKILIDPQVCFCYFVIVVFFGLIIRLLLSFTKAHELKLGGLDKDKKLLSSEYAFCDAVIIAFFSKNKIDRKLSDYWLPFWIGIVELSILPVLINSKMYEAIGAWIAIKALGQWKRWTISRTVYNRFILGNLLEILFSYILYRMFLSPVSHCCCGMGF